MSFFAVPQLDVVFRDALHVDFVDALKNADAVRCVHYIIAGGQLGKAVNGLAVFVLFFAFGWLPALMRPCVMSVNFAFGYSKPAESVPATTATVPGVMAERLSK